MNTGSHYTMITSRSEFHDAVRAAFAEAAEVGCRDIIISDIDFADWPLSDPPLIDSLTRWALAHRKLTVLAQTFDEIARRHGRWVAWRRTWSHIVECRSNHELEVGQMPTLLLASGLQTVSLVDPVHYRGSVSRSAADAVRGRELLDAALQRSEESFPVTNLGL